MASKEKLGLLYLVKRRRFLWQRRTKFKKEFAKTREDKQRKQNTDMGTVDQTVVYIGLGSKRDILNFHQFQCHTQHTIVALNMILNQNTKGVGLVQFQLLKIAALITSGFKMRLEQNFGILSKTAKS